MKSTPRVTPYSLSAFRDFRLRERSLGGGVARLRFLEAEPGAGGGEDGPASGCR